MFFVKIASKGTSLKVHFSHFHSIELYRKLVQSSLYIFVKRLLLSDDFCNDLIDSNQVIEKIGDMNERLEFSGEA